MKNSLLFIFFFMSLHTILAQNERFRFSVNTGIAIGLEYDGKTQDYTHLEAEAPFAYEKIGFYGSIEGTYFFNPKHSLTLGFAYREHQQKVKKGFYVSADSMAAIDVAENFNVKFSLKIFEGVYGYRLLSNSNNRLTLRAGLYYMRMRDQQIIFYDNSNYVLLLERNTKTHNLEELGISAGFVYERKLYEHVYFNLQSKYYYELSTGLQRHISITPGISIYF